MKYILFRSSLANQQLSDLLNDACAAANLTLEQNIEEVYTWDKRDLVVKYGVRTVPCLFSLSDDNVKLCETDNYSNIQDFIDKSEAKLLELSAEE